MIQVTVFQDSDKEYVGITLTGHAGYGEYGQDIVCASVSALVLNMANSVEHFTEDGFEGQVEEESGSFFFRFTTAISLESKLLMDSLILGLENIKEEYGAQYITIRFEEV
ncbi:MAG: ribosomal-processing cysteine protease Prp [Lachnospiraceae bacterium]